MKDDVLTQRQLVVELKRLGWKREGKHGWISPYYKHPPVCNIRDAASIEGIDTEILKICDRPRIQG